MIGFGRLTDTRTQMPDIRLEGPHITCRPPRPDDFAAWRDVRMRNYTHLKPYEPRWPHDALTDAFFKRRYARQLKDWQQDRGYAFILETKDGEISGGFNLNNVCRGAAQFATLGYWLAQEHQGKGLMTEAGRLISEYAFTHLKLHRLNAGIIPGNDKSRALLERLGFKEEGFAARYIEIDGKWADHILFGLTVEDWRNAKK